MLVYKPKNMCRTVIQTISFIYTYTHYHPPDISEIQIPDSNSGQKWPDVQASKEFNTRNPRKAVWIHMAAHSSLTFCSFCVASCTWSEPEGNSAASGSWVLVSPIRGTALGSKPYWRLSELISTECFLRCRNLMAVVLYSNWRKSYYKDIEYDTW